ncbi:hypothetical protein ALC62_04148, partial [Cyphomyrmex costatus]
SAVASKRKSTLARPRAMQRRDINKRLSFAEAENGQKDRNKEEVEEEREPATEKGINKSRSERGGKTERERGRGESAAPGPKETLFFRRNVNSRENDGYRQRCTCCELRWPLSSNGTNQPNQTITAATKVSNQPTNQPTNRPTDRPASHEPPFTLRIVLRVPLFASPL